MVNEAPWYYDSFHIFDGLVLEALRVYSRIGHKYEVRFESHVVANAPEIHQATLADFYRLVDGDQKRIERSYVDFPSAYKAGCPFASVWNGTAFILDNNLSPASELAGPGLNVRDFYKLEIDPAPENNLYLFRIEEFEGERSYC